MAAIIAVILIIILNSLFPGIFQSKAKYTDEERLSITGSIYSFEEKENSIYLVLKNVNVIQEDAASFSDSFRKAILIIKKTDLEKFDVENYKIGNIIQSKCLFRSFGKARNFGNFDEEDYYNILGISFKATAESIFVINTKTNPIRQFLFDIKNTISDSIQAAVNDDELASLFCAICLGEKASLSDESKKLFQQNGIAHVLAISGLHISFIGMFIFKLLRKKTRFIFAATFSGIFMITFCIMSGASPSSVRAVLMFLVQLTAIGLGKTYDLLCAISLAALLLILFNPLIIYNSGFILSFAAVLAAAVINIPLLDFLLPQHEELTSKSKEEEKSLSIINRFRSIRNKSVLYLVKSLVMSISVTIITLPVIINNYYEVPLYSIALNLMVIPLMSFILGSGLVSGLFGLLSIGFGRFIIGIGAYCLLFIQYICGFSYEFPYGKLVVGHVEKMRIYLYYGLLFLLLAILKRVNKIFVKAIVKRVTFFLLASTFLLFALLYQGKTENLNLYYFDVDQGDGIVLETPEGTVFTIDGGSSSVQKVAEYRLSGALKYQGIGKIDYAIITHPDFDHTSGIVEILQNKNTIGITIENIMIPDFTGNENYDQLIQLALEQDIKVITLKAGTEIKENDLEITCIYPKGNHSFTETNDNSAILLLEYGEFRALFTGDSGEEGENATITYFNIQNIINVNLLKVAHHGSRFSSSIDFINRISPSISVISAGVNNRYGHPHVETLERLNNVGSYVFNTADYGEIIIKAEKSGRCSIERKIANN